MNATTTSQTSAAFACDAVFFGDSITADGNFDVLFPRLRIQNLGVYGDTLEDLLRRVPEVRAARPAVIFLLGGINSLKDDNLERCVTQYRELAEALRTDCPDSLLCIQTVLPVGAEIEALLGCSNETVCAFNLRLKALAAELSLPVPDLWAAYEKDGALDPELTRDGLHLNFNVYDRWADVVRPYLEGLPSAD